ncbi:MAG: tRNA (N6-isopentenyl adenosine(37)-C2)-methylthiotransferase MiaB [Candidatus Peregrinibacteria bacterium]
MPKYLIHTFGCQMNYSDTERMETYLEALGYKKAASQSGADLILFNTCSIRQKAEDKALGHMRAVSALRRARPKLIIVMTGCMVRKSSSRYSPERDKLFSRVREIDIALKTDELPALASLIREINPKIKIPKIKEENIEDYFRISPAYNTLKSGTQAFIAISNGCDKFCTYCIVPYARGREKSRNPKDIFEEAKGLVEKGYKEITLIGQTVNSYGKSDYDKKNKTFANPKSKDPFVVLLKKLDSLHKKGLERVRFMSPHPSSMTDELIDAMGTLKTQMPYLHLPVQSGDNAVLKRMNRSYTVAQYKALIRRLRTRIPDISITTDIIVGFCGETEKEFKNTYDFFKEMQFEHAYIAQYSQRKGTVASRFMKDDIQRKIKTKRWNKLNDLLKRTAKKTLKRFIGKTVKVLVEEQSGRICLGRSEHFKTVQFVSNHSLHGKIVPVRVTGSKEWILEGDLISVGSR